MTEFSIISHEEFEQRKNHENTITINDELDPKIFYQLEFNEVMVLVSGIEAYKPKIKEISGYYVIFYIGCCYFYSLNKLKLLKRINNLVFVYDVFQIKKTIVLISEIDIYCFDTDLIEIKHIMTEDIITKYQIKNNLLFIELSNGEKKELKI